MCMFATARRSLVVLATLLLCASAARGADTLCDPSATNCRTRLLTLIQNERVGIDVGFWFMQDARYMTEIVKRWQAGVPVRILIDPRANADYPGNEQMIAGFQQAGIPLRRRTASGILHWKTMIFAGQNTVEFGSANYSPDAFVPLTPYANYVSETVFSSPTIPMWSTASRRSSTMSGPTGAALPTTLTSDRRCASIRPILSTRS